MYVLDIIAWILYGWLWVSSHNEEGCLFNDHCGRCGTIYGRGDFQIVCFDDGSWQYVKNTSGLKEVKGFGGEVYPAE